MIVANRNHVAPYPASNHFLGSVSPNFKLRSCSSRYGLRLHNPVDLYTRSEAIFGMSAGSNFCIWWAYVPEQWHHMYQQVKFFKGHYASGTPYAL